MKKKNLIYLTAILLLTTGCAANNSGTKESSAANTPADSSAESVQTKATLEKNNWYTNNVNALDQLITTYGKSSKDYDANNKPYAVFDWDNTTIINDIGEAVFTYQIENLAFKMTPDEFAAAVSKDIPGDSFATDFDNLNGEKVDITKISADLVTDYTALHSFMSAQGDNPALVEAKEKPEYQDFSTKLRYLYDAIGATFSPDISYPWVTYMFSGMTSKQVQDLTGKAIDHALQQDLAEVTWTSPADLSTKSGPVKISFKTGIRAVPEMKDLYNTLVSNGIDIYVCSASYLDVIIPFATSEKYGYNVPEKNIYAMRLVKNDDIIQAKFDTKYAQTQGEGKTKTIKEFMAPNHKNQDPILVCGDSSGDVAMLSDFPDLKMGIIFNRLKDGTIGDLAKKAIEEEGKTNQTYYLQGRDENSGLLVNSQETTLLGEKTAKLTK